MFVHSDRQYAGQWPEPDGNHEQQREHDLVDCPACVHQAPDRLYDPRRADVGRAQNGEGNAKEHRQRRAPDGDLHRLHHLRRIGPPVAEIRAQEARGELGHVARQFVNSEPILRISVGRQLQASRAATVSHSSQVRAGLVSGGCGTTMRAGPLSGRSAGTVMVKAGLRSAAARRPGTVSWQPIEIRDAPGYFLRAAIWWPMSVNCFSSSASFAVLSLRRPSRRPCAS